MEVAPFSRKVLFVLAVVFSNTLISPGYAATQGNLGKTSTGSFSITLTISPRLQASLEATQQSSTEESVSTGLRTNSVVSKARFNQKEPLCIKGTGISSYSLTAEGSGDLGAFTITTSNTGNSVNYDVELWKNDNSHESLSPGQFSQPLLPTPIRESCENNSASIAVVLEQQVASDEASMTGVLNLTVSPE